jgi:plasmid maintenance system antidote protein VapI
MHDCLKPAIGLSKAFGSTPGTWVRRQAAFDLAVARKDEENILVERYSPRPVPG